MKTIKAIFIIAILTMTIVSCKDTGILYDKDQLSSLYFAKSENESVIPMVSFALELENQIEYKIPVKAMGVPRPFDRDIELTFKQDTIKKYLVGSDSVNVIMPTEGVDFEVISHTIKAGEVGTEIVIRCHRQPLMLDNYMSLFIEVKESLEFKPLRDDFFRIFISDGEPSEPYWWATGDNPSDVTGWSRFIGKFYPQKFRRLLQLYWDMADTNPEFYATYESKYGKYLEKEGIPYSFWFNTTASGTWATYMMIPLYEHYKLNPIPGDSEFKNTGTPALKDYWQDPIGLLR